MLYLVYVLTFLAGILFYALSPRDDQVQLDAYKAEGFIASFLAQHQAAKDYMSQWLGVYPLPGHTSFNLTKKVGGDFVFEEFIPQMTIREVSESQGNSVGTIAADAGRRAEYITSVICVDKGTGGILSMGDCTSNDAQPYLVTYSDKAAAYGRPSWWPSEESNRQRRYGSWRNAITRRSNGSYNCGVLVDVPIAGTGNRQWCIDNGQRVFLPGGSRQCAQKVPNGVAQTLGCINGGEIASECSDTFLCISRIKQGPNKYYVPGLTAFYDGINNLNEGAEGERGSDEWRDMIRTGKNATNIVTNVELAFRNGISFPDLNVINGDGLFRNFTLTVLLKAEDRANTKIKLDTNGYFTLDVQQEDGQTLSVQFNHNNSEGTENWMSAEINGINIRTQIVSLTLVGHSSQLDVYVNEGLVGKVTARAIDQTEKANIVNSGGGNLSISSLDDPVQIYGVRYYDGRALTGTRQRTTDGFTPSEIEKNFKVDSKRYRIESTCNSTACNRCLRDADTEAEKKECRQKYLCPEIE